MIIDVHVHFGFLYFPIETPTANSIINTMDQFGIDISIISNIQGLFYDFRDCNEIMFSAIEQHPKRLKGYVVLNPNYPEISKDKLMKFKDHPQFAGVKLHASWHNSPIDGTDYEKIFEWCDELKIPMLIHSYVVDDYDDQVSSPERIANVAKRCSNSIIMAHMGGNARRACKAAAGIENLYMDISSGRERAEQLYVWQLDRIAGAVNEVGAEHILFGTDFPLLDPSICCGMFEDANIDSRTREMISWENANRIFNFVK